jgi:hypothetical protein
MHEMAFRFITGTAFRSDGAWEKKWCRNSDGSESAVLRRFGADGLLLTEERTGGETQTLVYDYDTFGRLERVTVISVKGAERPFESYCYHEDGTSTQTSYIDISSHPPNSFGVDEEGLLDMSMDAVCIRTVRNAAGAPLHKVLLDARDEIIRHVLYKYNETGHLIEEGEIDVGSDLREDLRNLYSYDELGRRIGAQIYRPFCGWSQRFSYNTAGDVNEEIVIPLRHGRGDPFEQSPHSSTSHEYKYDTQNNWTYRKTRVRDLDDGRTLYTAETQRTVEYWHST